MITLAPQLPEDRGTLVAPNWRLHSAVTADLANLTDVREWQHSFDHDRGILTATARGNEGAYTLISFQGTPSLVLMRDRADVDLSRILTDSDVGFAIGEVAQALVTARVEEKRITEALPELATRPVRLQQTPHSWHVSAQKKGAYLYYQEGAAQIQVTLMGAGEPALLYSVKIQPIPQSPWNDITQHVRATPELRKAITGLLNAPVV